MHGMKPVKTYIFFSTKYWDQWNSSHTQNDVLWLLLTASPAHQAFIFIQKNIRFIVIILSSIEQELMNILISK